MTSEGNYNKFHKLISILIFVLKCFLNSIAEPVKNNYMQKNHVVRDSSKSEVGCWIVQQLYKKDIKAGKWKGKNEIDILRFLANNYTQKT